MKRGFDFQDVSYTVFYILLKYSSHCQLFYLLTHWGQEKMAAIFQTTFSNTFSSMKMYKFRLRFHWSLFPRVQLTIFQHLFRKWLGAVQATNHYLNQWWLIYWRIYDMRHSASMSSWYNVSPPDTLYIFLIYILLFYFRYCFTIAYIWTYLFMLASFDDVYTCMQVNFSLCQFDSLPELYQGL